MSDVTFGAEDEHFLGFGKAATDQAVNAAAAMQRLTAVLERPVLTNIAMAHGYRVFVQGIRGEKSHEDMQFIHET